MNYKFTEEEEDRLTEIVMHILRPVLFSLTASNTGSGTDLESLEECIDISNQSAEEAADSFDTPQYFESVNGYSAYRNYSELKDRPAAVVMIADALRAAEQRGYRWRLLETPDAAIKELAGYKAYQSYIEKIARKQAAIVKAEEKAGRDPGILKSQTLRAKPVIELEKDGTKQQIIFMESIAGKKKQPATIMIFSDSRATVLHEDFYFHGDMHDQEADFEKQFGQ